MTGKEARRIRQARRSNQDVEKEAGMLVNQCNSSKSERKMKGCQVGSGQSSCGEQGRRSPYVIVVRKKIKEVVRSKQDISSNEEQGRQSTRATVGGGVYQVGKDKVNN